MKGRTYEEIYGAEKARELIEKRRQAKIDFVKNTTPEQRRKPLNFQCTCLRCHAAFMSADKKANSCTECRKCVFCGKRTSRIAHQTCKQCSAKQRTPAQVAQLAKNHTQMFGENNPAKRPGVGAKISRSLKANHPAKLNPEPYRQHMSRIRPNKTSKLEGIAKPFLEKFTYQCRVDYYAIDFADTANQIAVEIQGCWHHCCQECFPDSPKFATQLLTINNDKRKHSYLVNHGWQVVYVWEHDLRQNPAQAIADALNNLH